MISPSQIGVDMKAAELYTYLKQAIGSDLKPKDLDQGQAFFWKELRVGSNSTRVLRIHEDASGNITEIKLPVTSLRAKTVTTLPLPATFDDVVTAVRREIDLLEK
jgi:hypothetical protein